MWKTLSLNPNYRISDDGRLYNIKTHRELQGYLDKDGYRCFTTRLDGRNVTYKAHRLVAMEYIPNPNNYPQVNHKNLNKSDNRVDNLEWVTHQQNIEHWRQQQEFATSVNLPIAYRESKLNKGKQVVCQYTLDGKEVARYPSMNKAKSATGISIVQIARCVHGEISHAGNYIFKQQ